MIDVVVVGSSLPSICVTYHYVLAAEDHLYPQRLGYKGNCYDRKLDKNSRGIEFEYCLWWEVQLQYVKRPAG